MKAGALQGCSVSGPDSQVHCPEAVSGGVTFDNTFARRTGLLYPAPLTKHVHVLGPRKTSFLGERNDPRAAKAA
jgi:hypothetical protein